MIAATLKAYAPQRPILQRKRHDGSLVVLNRAKDLLQNFAQPEAKFPLRIMRLKFPHIADPPDVIADAIALLVMPGEFAAADFFTKRNRFQHRAIAKAPTAHVIDFRYARLINEGSKRFHQIEAMNVIAHLFALVTEDAIGPADDATLHQVSEKPVQLSASVSWAGQTAAAKTRRRHSEIAAILLQQNICRDFRGPKKGMLGRIDAHGLGNPRFVFVTGLDLPARFEFA